MKKKPATQPDAAELRHHAEAELSRREKKAAPPPTTGADTRRLVQELEVHQIELEMQNEELVRARAEVEALLRQYTDLYDFAPAGHFTLARDGAIHQVNLAGANLLGVERGALINRRLGIFVSSRSRTTFNTFLEKVFGSQRKETCEVAFQKDGSAPLWMHIEAIAEDGQECRAVALNITERKRAEERILYQKTELAELNRHLKFANVKLKELDRVKSDFLSTVSHEIRTPIAIIREAVSLCLDGAGGKLSEQHCQYLNSAQSNIDRLTRLVNGLLDVSKIDQKKLTLRRSSIDIWNTARKIHHEYELQAEFKGIRLELDKRFSGNSLRFYGDEDKIIQILNNLLSNAIRNTKSGGRITIQLIDDNDFVKFTVADTGIGISKENASKLFTKFQQIERTDSPGYQGTGLGLAICRGLVERLGGQIWVESELGQGSAFSFTLRKVTFPKILIVDDDMDIVLLVKQMLSEAEYRFVEAYDGEQAVKIAQNERINLILLDMKLPTMSGYEVISRLRQNKRTLNIPILIMSAFSVDLDEVDMVNAETAIPMIRKPFGADALKEAVEELLID